MKQNSTLEAIVLERARRGLGPSTAQRRSTLERLARGLALEAPPSAPLDEFPAPEPSNPSLSAGKLPAGAAGVSRAGALAAVATIGGFSLRAMVVGVLTGAVLGFGAGVVAVSVDAPSRPLSTSQHAPSSASSRIVEHAHRSHTDRPNTKAKELVATPELEPMPAPPAHPAAAHGESGRKRPSDGRRQASLSTSGSVGASDATFYEELSYVRRAQSALHEGNAILALGLMRSLDEIQPRGALLTERNLIQVLALCQLDRSAEAAGIARGMSNGDGTADVYRRRLASSCVGASLSEAPEHDQ